MKSERPGLVIEINGGIEPLAEVAEHLVHVDAVMIGRAAYDRPLLFTNVDARFFDGGQQVKDAFEVVERLMPYMEAYLTSEAVYTTLRVIY